MVKKTLVILLLLSLVAVCVGIVWAESGDPKVSVDHKGNLICVDLDSVPAHVAHGDYTELIPCAP